MKMLEGGVLDIADRYQFFIFDVWGVVHDGGVAYEGTIEAIRYLRALGKNISFLSNAPRRAASLIPLFEKLGIATEMYDFILTSGEAAYLDFKKRNFNDDLSALSDPLRRRYFLIGPERDSGLLSDLPYQRSYSICDSSFILNTGFGDDESNLSSQMKILSKAVELNLLLICVNPDLSVVKKGGEELLCAGALAMEYEKMGGRTSYYGKPFKPVYRAAHEMFAHYTSGRLPEMEEMVAVGDGIETDIKGARDFGIDSVLITSGKLAKIVNREVSIDMKRVESLCYEHGARPTYITRTVSSRF